ncbi:Bro-N domain-containing protein [Patescibacteria group bacterium]|nr:Bro-N domain-containing protein [Patescibacteria group bacterium]MBU1721744.1 Bro-N domain-containing protein [Patescibacteria group bacterium]MBU1901417.1 Bro-N domain-containing protein [Patescibacteria group bacterium]
MPNKNNTEKQSMALFHEKKVRRYFDEEQELWYFSVIDVIAILTDSSRPRKYWNALKTKLKEDGSQLSQDMGQLKMLSSDGKKYLTDVATTEQLFRLIQSVPSPKAEPFKLWLAKVGETAGKAREDIEKKIGESVVSSDNATQLQNKDRKKLT